MTSAANDDPSMVVLPRRMFYFQGILIAVLVGIVASWRLSYREGRGATDRAVTDSNTSIRSRARSKQVMSSRSPSPPAYPMEGSVASCYRARLFVRNRARSKRVNAHPLARIATRLFNGRLLTRYKCAGCFRKEPRSKITECKCAPLARIATRLFNGRLLTRFLLWSGSFVRSRARSKRLARTADSTRRWAARIDV